MAGALYGWPASPIADPDAGVFFGAPPPIQHTSHSMKLGYCTNVHAGANWRQTRDNLQRYAAKVRGSFAPRGTMGIGLWLSYASVQELFQSGATAEFAAWLAEEGLAPFTLNGFPYGDFHEPVVKHRVYHPTWMESERLDYTLALVRLLHELLPVGEEGSISTLPICWGSPAPEPGDVRRACDNLRRAADAMARLEKETGRLIYLCLEPEPGCYLQRSEDIVRLFEDHLLPGGDERAIRRHLRVCHDICHASVMFEPQRQALDRYQEAGIGVGKVQISAAVRVSFDAMTPPQREQARGQLAAFAEDRYLHQTSIRAAAGGEVFYEDLPLALSSPPHGEWRIHFHVPVYVGQFGLVSTTQSDILEALTILLGRGDCRHYEVETYAWGVLPTELRQGDLAVGIAQEMRWAADQMAVAGGGSSGFEEQRPDRSRRGSGP